MRKILAITMMLTMIFSFSVMVMAEDSPAYNGTTASTETTSTEEYFGGTTSVTNDETTTNDEYSNSTPTSSESKNSKTTTTVTSSSPKTADMGTPTVLVFVVLGMAAITIYAGKRARE